jgi:hypothetical protein
MFMKGSTEGVKSLLYPWLRVKYLTATEDYVIKERVKVRINNDI